MTSSQASALLAGLAVVAAAALFGALARRLGQPPVVGEILAGILLRPTVFDGAVSRAAADRHPAVPDRPGTSPA
ncbi:cation:proton antiporter [Streptomyces sp. NPDC050549]|uniref:cation:proton antiporter n=1 Tax=Streptomyces sp. NPDC050549 TaxID=3155406 RepID=UPI003430E5A6